jgi:hypothetical protein
MSNGDEWGVINTIRKDVADLNAYGCAHKQSQDRDMAELRTELRQAKTDIWSAIDREREAREGLLKQIVINVLAIVVGGVILNIIALSYLLPTVLK